MQLRVPVDDIKEILLNIELNNVNSQLVNLKWNQILI